MCGTIVAEVPVLIGAAGHPSIVRKLLRDRWLQRESPRSRRLLVLPTGITILKTPLSAGFALEPPRHSIPRLFLQSKGRETSHPMPAEAQRPDRRRHSEPSIQRRGRAGISCRTRRDGRRADRRVRQSARNCKECDFSLLINPRE